MVALSADSLAVRLECAKGDRLVESLVAVTAVQSAVSMADELVVQLAVAKDEQRVVYSVVSRAE